MVKTKMAENISQNPTPGANEQDIQLIIKKLAYVGIQFKNTADKIWGDFAHCDNEERKKLTLELDLARNVMPEKTWQIRKAVIKLTDPASTERQKENAEATISFEFERFSEMFNILLRNCIREERKQKYLQLSEEFNKIKEMIEKTVLS
ncbi:hypothetical protein [Sulfolobus tengchongensis spindle-shaped virus 3]|nr:hypothetical protein [Sulfolobus tengchongensis spindle-shaped virus 3]